MFREFNVKFEDVEMLGGADNLLEGTEVTKVIVRGDSKMSSLDSMLKDCNELDTIDGELDLNGVSDIDNLLEGTELVKNINLKNINNENISANNSFPNVDRINIGGELYNKKAMQNVIASKEWTFDNITYSGTVGDNVVVKEVNVIDDNKVTIQDTLEQKAKGIEIIGQTYENLVEGSGEYKLTDTFSTTWTESNNSIENPPSMIEIPEIWGNTVQGYANCVTSKQIVDSLVLTGFDLSSTLYDDGSFRVSSHTFNTNDTVISNNDNFIQLKANTLYSVCSYRLGTTTKAGVYYILGNSVETVRGGMNGYKFTTDASGKVLLHPPSMQGAKVFIRVTEGDVDLSQYAYDEYDLNYIQSAGDLYVDEEGTPILDEEGNEQYKLEIENTNKNLFSKFGRTYPETEVKHYTMSWFTSFDGSTYKLRQEVAGTNLTGQHNILTPTLGNTGRENNPILFKGKTYTISGIFKWKENPKSLEIGFHDSNGGVGQTLGNLYGGVPTGSLEGSFVSYTFTPKVDLHSIYLRLPYGGSFTFDLEVSNFMIEENTVATEYVKPQSNKTTILMPQRLSKFKPGIQDNSEDYSDKLYYDILQEKFFINSRISEYHTGEVTYNGQWGNVWEVLPKPSDIIDSTSGVYLNPIWIKGSIQSGWGSTHTYPKVIGVSTYASGIARFNYNPNDSWTNKEISEYFSNKDGYYLHPPKLVECKILEKPSLETYSPKTYISTNTEIQPSQMTVTNKRNLINLRKMKSNTDYTLQLKCNKKGNKPIKINLCGKEKDIDATIGVNHINVTTNELNDNNLELSGEGNVVSEIIVVEGEMNQYPEYFDGVQNTGELQDDGTYLIGIKTNEGFNVSIQTNNALAKGDKLYWNKSNKRYEIDRGGSIEVPSVTGDVIDLPRLYQREDTCLTVESGNIKPSKIKINYLDID